jgi:hypothetical protein
MLINDDCIIETVASPSKLKQEPEEKVIAWNETLMAAQEALEESIVK